MTTGPYTNTGHGHVWQRPDGVKARCGGPPICIECARDASLYLVIKRFEEGIAERSKRPFTGYEDHTESRLRNSLEAAEEAMRLAQGRITRIKREQKRRKARHG